MPLTAALCRPRLPLILGLLLVGLSLGSSSLAAALPVANHSPAAELVSPPAKPAPPADLRLAVAPPVVPPPLPEPFADGGDLAADPRVTDSTPRPTWAVEGNGHQVAESPFGPRYRLESIEIRGNRKTHDSVIRAAILFSPGDVIAADDPRVDLSRFRVLSLGFFSDVKLSLRRGQSRGQAVLVVEVVERGTLVLNDIFLGTSQATAVWGGLDVAENNFLGRGISLSGAFVLGGPPSAAGACLQQGYRLRLGVPSLRGGRLGLLATLLHNDASELFRVSGTDSDPDPAHFAAARYRRLGGIAGLSVDVGRFSRLTFDYRFEGIEARLPTGVSRLLPDGSRQPIDFALNAGRSYVSSLTLAFEHDTRSDPVLPRSGTRLALALELSAGLIGSSYDFAKLTGLGQRWFRLRRDQVISLQLFVGAVFGAAPLFDRFHIGDLNALVAPRALGLTFSTLPSRNLLRDGIQRHRYGELAARVLVEYAYPLFRGRRYVYGGDLFVNAGLFVLADNEDLRSRSGPLWCSLPMDLTFDLGLRLDTLIGVFNLSLANALGRLPF